MTRRTAVVALLVLALTTAGCVEFGGSGRTSVGVDAERVESVPDNATVVAVSNDSIAGTPLEAVVREAAENGSASTTVPPERSAEVETAQARLPRETHPTAEFRDGTYVRVDETVVFVEIEWPA